MEKLIIPKIENRDFRNVPKSLFGKKRNVPKSLRFLRDTMKERQQ